MAAELLRGHSPAMWWVAACVGVEIIHAMLEFSLWYAHFLAISALLMGVGAGTGIRLHPYVSSLRRVRSEGLCFSQPP